MSTTFCIDGRLAFHSGKNMLSRLDNPDLTEVLNEPCARCLETLLAAQGNVVSQAELYKAGWGKAHKDVSPNTLYQNILLARKAFRKVAENNDDFIITVPRNGFRFNENLAVTVCDNLDNPAAVSDEPESVLRGGRGDNISLRQTLSPLLLRVALPASALFIFLSAIMFMFMSFSYGLSRHDDFNADYVYAGNHAGCEIYLIKRQSLADVNAEQILRKWPDITSGCDRLPLRYVSPYRNLQSVFYLACDIKEKADRICSSGYRRLSE